MDEHELAELLETPGRPEPSRPPLDSIVRRSRRRRTRRARAVGAAALAAALAASGLGVGLSGAGGPVRHAAARSGGYRAPAGLRFVASERPSARAGEAPTSGGGPKVSPRRVISSPVSPSRPLGQDGSSVVCSVIGCGAGAWTRLTQIFNRRFGHLRLVAMLAQSAPAGPPDRLPTGVWKPIAGSGLAERAVNACVSADRLVLTLEPAAGEGPPVSQLAVPFGAASGHPIDAVASVAMGSSSSGRVEAVAVKTAADVRSVLAVFPDGRSQRAAVVDGWAVLAVALEGKPHGVVEVTAMGRTGGVLERVSVPASGSLALRPVVCHPLVPPAVSGTPTSLPIAGSSGVSAGS